MRLSSVDSHQTRKKAGIGWQTLEDVLLAAIIELHIEVSSPRIQFHHDLLPAERWIIDALEAVNE